LPALVPEPQVEAYNGTPVQPPVRSARMALDPRTPVIVGVGQITNRADPDVDLADRPEPAVLMADALRRAAEDCDGVAVGGVSPAGDQLLKKATSLRVVGTLGWRVVNPALAVGELLGIDPPELVFTGVGGNMPQSLLNDSALAIARGDADVVLVTGAECMYTRSKIRRSPDERALDWLTQPPDTPAPVVFGTDRPPATDLEMTRGVLLPIHAYPLFENAIRAANGWSIEEHLGRIAKLWAGFSQVAATNPYAWFPEARTAEEIANVGPANRMISFPYPKLCTAIMGVDQGAGFIVCSVEAAKAAGVSQERWVFPLSGTDAHEHWFLSHRLELHRSPAIRLAGTKALALAEVGVDDLGPIDLYSCFPAVVQMAANELGLPIDDPGRPLTLTGGLTFAGGPGNNYVSHSIASAVTRLRETPDSVGLVTGLGWYATKHAIGVYASRPPVHEGREGFRWENVQDEVDALPQRSVDSDATGEVTIETYTVSFDRDGVAERGIIAVRTAEEHRAWANINDADQLTELVTTEGCGRQGSLDEAGILSLH
jgi:acetyl-CoA C-acetyltransferase